MTPSPDVNQDFGGEGPRAGVVAMVAGHTAENRSVAQAHHCDTKYFYLIGISRRKGQQQREQK